MQKRRFIKNALFLTITSLILRFLGVFVRIWLSNNIGAEGMGLYQLVISIYVLASAFAAGGLTTAVTRQVADRLAFCDKKGAVKALRVSIVLTAVICAVSIFIIVVFRNFIACNIVQDARSYASLLMMCIALPFMGFASCFKGYFLARRKAGVQSIALLLEQTVRIVLMFVFVSKFKGLGMEYAVAAVMLSDALAEGAGLCYLLIAYFVDKKHVFGGGKAQPFKVVLRQNLHISVPITAGKYLSTFLRTTENLIVPSNLAKYTASYKTSLEQFGMIKGMALPILFFPASLLSSITTLLIPEMSEAKAKNDKDTIFRATEKSIKITLLSAFIFAAVFFCTADKIGLVIYKSKSVGYLIKALSPLVPLMYLDSMSDGILKGLDKQNATFVHSLIDSVSRISLILIFVPRFGMLAFLSIMFVSNALTCFLNTGKLLKTIGSKFPVVTLFLLPLFLVVLSSGITAFILLEINILSDALYIVFFMILDIAIYLLFLLLTGQLKDMQKLSKNKRFGFKKSSKIRVSK